MPKIKDRYSEDRKERDYIKRMSVFTGNMGCRYCEEKIRIENQEHLEQCEGVNYKQRGLELSEEMGKLIFRRRMASKL